MTRTIISEQVDIEVPGRSGVEGVGVGADRRVGADGGVGVGVDGGVGGGSGDGDRGGDGGARASAMGAYLARPAIPGDHPVVLIGSELWGVTDDVRGVTRQVAELGYVAIAPNLYHRAGPETATGLAQNDANRQRGFELIGRLTRDEVEADLRAAVSYARGYAGAADKTAMLGFSFGGHVAYFAAARLGLAAAAVYFPGWLTQAGTGLSRPDPLVDASSGIAEHDTRVRLFFAGRDRIIDADQRQRIEAALASAGARHDVTVYPDAQHAFFFPGPESYDKEAAEDSWRRVVELFAAELR
ncbi:dienelactone hydrolase family protein [Streptomyces beihaiensis]|uniref:Dienelactone hydrolase family protein n=1 Tax=Streptomyces beihaiensis TaxID=2984495 RepID=A0ABT3TN33_9ACTN|nr:dienelactone hydrolase family protein [Streptomyces beihaiensis]MCX3058454.1 dienelactone hydrolase family protein [Streptomyces beihaiensis]